MSDQLTLQPIATFQSNRVKAYQAPRQGVLSSQSAGIITLKKHLGPISCEDLEGFDRLWLIYSFHKNSGWSPKVRPPRFSTKKRSVFATRSPYRPNSLGLSCVRLVKIEGATLHISEHDLLDGTPILDIKPYLPYADSFPKVKTGWLPQNVEPFCVEFKDSILEELLWMEQWSDINFMDVLKNQLAYEPWCSKAKRVKKKGDYFEFAIRTWRFQFCISGQKIQIFQVDSGYSRLELESNDDPHSDKDMHRKFLELFKTSQLE